MRSQPEMILIFIDLKSLDRLARGIEIEQMVSIRSGGRCQQRLGKPLPLNVMFAFDPFF
jgi:hypothetical protein